MLCYVDVDDLKYLTQRSYIGRTGVGLHRVSGVVSLAPTAGWSWSWRHHQTALYAATVLGAPVTGDEEDVSSELDVVLLTLPLALLGQQQGVKVEEKSCNNNNTLQHNLGFTRPGS